MAENKVHLDTDECLDHRLRDCRRDGRLRLAEDPDCKILVITRDPDPHESNSRYAQGGIVGRGHDDNADLLVKDILAAGAGASSPKAARILAEEGPRSAAGDSDRQSADPV